MKRPHVALFLLLASLQITVSQPFASTNAPPGASGGPEYVPGEVLIKFRSDVTDEQIATAFRGASLRFLKQVQTTPMRDAGQIGITHAATVVPVEQAVAVLRQVAGVEYAEPNWIYTHQADPEAADTYYANGGLWGMYGPSTSPNANLFGSGAGTVWATTLGSKTVYIGVIDEGIQFSHPDLLANIWKNPEEKEGNRRDDDGNGYKDDIYGWNSYSDNGITYDSRYDDHGTHVAGTIGAAGNGQGVIGVSPNISIITGKFLGPNGGTTSDAIQVIDYMTALKTKKGLNIVALNNSWGGGGFSQLLLDAIVRAAKQNILFVAAAGNGDANNIGFDTDATPNYPSCYDTTLLAGYDSVIAVAAIGSDGNMPIFSNYGVETVDLGAPGVGITSTLPNGAYGSSSGTSMATPHVTGAIALYASKHPTATAAQIKDALLNSVTPTSSLEGKTATGGRLDIPACLTPVSTLTVPVLTAIAGDARVSLSWTETEATEYKLYRRTSAEQYTLITTTSLFAYTDNNVVNGNTYYYKVDVIYNSGESVSSRAVAATPSLPASAKFVNSDTTTQGSWVEGNVLRYGQRGYETIHYAASVMSGTLAISLPLGGACNWNLATTDIRALQKPDKGDRFASCVYLRGSFEVEVNLAKEQQVSLYFLDWDRRARTQTIEVIDPNNNNAILDTREVTAFGNGVYLKWNVAGRVIFRITWTGGDNAVLSGVFFDPVVILDTIDEPPTVSITSPVNGATVSGIVTVTASAADAQAVNKVEFYAGGTLIGSDSNGSDGWSVSWDTSQTSDGPCNLTARAFDATQSAGSSITEVIVVNGLTSTTVHCGDIDAAKASTGKTWKATVTVAVHDKTDQVVAGATVEGAWNGGATVSGTTGDTGTVTFTLGSIPRTLTSVNFTVSNVTGSGLTYDAEANHDADGDSNGTSITVLKP